MASLLRNLSFVLMGNRHFTKDGYLRRQSCFDNGCMQQSLDGRICIVTGANAGLGLQISHELGKRGATLYMVCRNKERGSLAAQAVKAATGNNNVHLAVCDVSSLASVAEFAADWVEAGRPLHLLVNNAGVLLNSRQLTPEGHELSFATNTLGTLALTQRLLPALAAGAPSRVVFVSSGGMYTAPLLLDDLSHSKLTPWDGVVAYARDKRRQVALAEHLADSWRDKGISVYSMHPGWCDTEGVRTSIPGFHKAFKHKLRDAEQGADTVVWLALEDASKLEPGAFYLDRQPQQKHLSFAGTNHSKDVAAQLFQKLMEVAGINSADDAVRPGKVIACESSVQI